jgi:hypothetical protein
MSEFKPMTSKAAARNQRSTAKSSTSGNVTKGSFAVRTKSTGAKNTNN